MLESGRPVAELFLHSTQTHSRRLMHTCEFLLLRLGKTYKDITLVTVSLGPGSFTGLRIGLATAKGLAYALGLPVVGVPSLDALAAKVLACEGDYICPVVHARISEVYSALYMADGKGGFERITDYDSMSPENLASGLPGTGRVWFLGDGLGRHWKIFQNALGSRALRVPDHLLSSGASTVGVLGVEKYRNSGRGHDLYSLVPLYVRPSEAEIKYKVRK